MARLDGKIAVVTGGTQGLGAAIARHFASIGMAGVLVAGRSRDRGEAVAREICERWATPSFFVATDLASVDDCRRLVACADEKFGRIDILVNAAGRTDRGTVLDTTPETFDALFNVNVRAPFFLIQEAVRLMRRDHVSGSIVNIGSMSSLAGQPIIAAYCASKGALATLTRNVAFALLPDRIRVNALNIGWMASDGEDQVQRRLHGSGDGWQASAGALLPLGRLLEPEEVAQTVAFLASDDSGAMTGAVIEYDQSVWGAYENAPVPAGRLPDAGHRSLVISGPELKPAA